MEIMWYLHRKQIPDLVDVDGCDPSGVTLQGEEAAGVLQTVNLSNSRRRITNLRVRTFRKHLARHGVAVLPEQCGPGCR